ncbi:MAG: hypothetical protein QOF60_221 [Actinomycetota bacterium]|jgi:hypothetical protein|nr:hypothetical protein [Actinomycetota bacterium]
MHRDARLTPPGRLLLCQRIEAGWPVVHAAAATIGISRDRAYVWWRRYQAEGPAGRRGHSVAALNRRRCELPQQSHQDPWPGLSPVDNGKAPCNESVAYSDCIGTVLAQRARVQHGASSRPFRLLLPAQRVGLYRR